MGQVCLHWNSCLGQELTQGNGKNAHDTSIPLLGAWILSQSTDCQSGNKQETQKSRKVFNSVHDDYTKYTKQWVWVYLAGSTVNNYNQTTYCSWSRYNNKPPKSLIPVAIMINNNDILQLRVDVFQIPFETLAIQTLS